MILSSDGAGAPPKPGCRVAPAEGGLAMQMLRLDQLGDQIAELSAHLDAATARLLDLIREFDARDGWSNGFSCCAAWLTWRVGLAPGAAREHVRVARALGTLPLLARALARAELSYSKVRALTRVATPETEERLLAVGRAGTTEHVERIVRGWRRMDRKAEAREAERQHANRALHVYPDEDGTVRIRGAWPQRSVPCSCRRWPPPVRRWIRKTFRRERARRACPRKRPPWSSSRRTRWPCSQRPRSTTASSPAPRANATRWWSTSMRRSWPTPTRPA